MRRLLDGKVMAVREQRPRVFPNLLRCRLFLQTFPARFALGQVRFKYRLLLGIKTPSLVGVDLGRVATVIELINRAISF